jgi:hypothetical protein
MQEFKEGHRVTRCLAIPIRVDLHCFVVPVSLHRPRACHFLPFSATPFGPTFELFQTMPRLALSGRLGLGPVENHESHR